MVFYYIPFLSNLFFEWPELELVIYCFGGITNLLFFGIELIQMQNAGVTQYFKESFWNILEFVQFFLYVYYVVVRVEGDFPDLMK